MKILLMDWNYIANACRHYFYKELSRRVDVVTCPFTSMNRTISSSNMPYNRQAAYPYSLLRRFLSLPNYLKKLNTIIKNENPDTSHFNERFPSYVKFRKVKEIDKVPKTIFMCDRPRRDYHQLMNFIKINSINFALHLSPLWEKDLPEDIETRLVPWSVDTTVFKDYGQQPMYDIVAAGVLSWHYPMRYEIKKMLENSQDLKCSYLEYPCVSPIIGRKMNMEKYFIEYAKFLSNSKIFLFFPGIPRRTIAKYVEGLASSSLMMAPMPAGGEIFHLEPGKNFVEVNEKNFKEKASYYLEHEEERIKIAKRGMETARKYLDVKDSVGNFIKIMKEVV